MNKDDLSVKKMIKLKKLKKAKIEKDEEKIMSVKDHEEFTKLATKDVMSKIDALKSKLAEYSGTLTEQTKKKKRNLVNKIKYLKKVLKSADHLKRRVNLLKLQKRKAIRKERKIIQIQDKLKKMKLKCLFCKKKGHVVAECKAKNEPTEEPQPTYNHYTYTSKNENICFNCGKKDHNIYGCGTPVDMKNLPFADCFVCKSKGHLASHCPESDKGIYIKGGSCFNCGSKEHLAKNCPTKQTEIAFENEKRDYRTQRRAPRTGKWNN
jgi:zinc finger CCHC domain-containing protein 9